MVLFSNIASYFSVFSLSVTTHRSVSMEDYLRGRVQFRFLSLDPIIFWANLPGQFKSLGVKLKR